MENWYYKLIVMKILIDLLIIKLNLKLKYMVFMEMDYG